MAVYRRGPNKDGKYTWYAEWRLPKRLGFDGRKCRVGFGSKDNAEIELAKRKEALRDGTYLLKYSQKGRDKRLVTRTFGDVAQELLDQRAQDRGWKRRTISNNGYASSFLVSALGEKRLADINALDVERYKRKRRKQVSGPTVNRELALLSALLQVAVESGELIANPVRGIRRYRENENAWQYLSPDEADRLIAACAPRLRPVVLCAIFTGMRAGEIRDLLWDYVDLRRELIWIRDTKSGEPREIPIHSVLRRELVNLRRRRISPHVFTKANGEQYRDWRSAWRTATQQAKLEGLRFHDLRHTFGTWQTSAGTHPFIVQALMGHRTQAMTRRYSHATSAGKRTAVDKLPSVGGTDKLRELAPTSTPTRRRRAADHSEH
ncbi:MAG: site-specific integrase [Acidobacteria bacterium]|nr:site-specific integrase [Acidobacteriota bacterium]